MLEAAEQVRASLQLTDEQLGQLVRKTRSRTQAAPSAGASTSTARNSSSSSCSEESRCSEDRTSN